MIKKPYPESLKAVFASNENSIGSLIARANHIARLNAKLQAFMSPELAQKCNVVSYNNGILGIVADSAAYATQLKFQIPELREKLRSLPEWVGLRSINISVSPAKSELNFERKLADKISKERIENEKPTMTKEGAQHLKDFADSLEGEENRKLKEIIERLSKHGK